MEHIGKPRFVPSATEVRYGVEMPIATIGGGGGGHQGPQGPRGYQGPQGEHGHLGPQGPQGTSSAGWKMRGEVDSVIDLPAEEVNGAAYIVGSRLFIYIGPGLGRPDTPGDAYIDTPIAIIGPQGAQGAQGAAGRTGSQGWQGARGPQGYQGADGTSMNIIGDVDTLDDLPWPAMPGDTYSCQGYLYMFKGENQGDTPTPHDAWKKISLDVRGVQGPQGYRGEPGPAGPQGASGKQGTDGKEGPQGPQGPEGVAGFADSRNVTLGVDVPVTSEVGGYKVGDVIPASETIFNIIRRMVTKVIIPEYIAPEAESLTEGGEFDGTTPRNLKFKFTQNDAGSNINWRILRNDEEIASGVGSDVIYQDAEEVLADITYRCIFDYSEGDVKYDSLGNPVPGHILPGSIELEVNFTFVANKNFLYLFSPEDVTIDQLTSADQFTEYADTVHANDQFQLRMRTPSEVIGFAVKEGLAILECLQKGIMNMDIINAFTMTKKELTQDGEQVMFNIYLYDPMEPMGADTFTITIEEE